MSVLVWGIAAVVAGLAVTAIGVWVVGRRHAGPPLGEPLPTTPLQRLAFRGLLVGAVLTVGLVGWVLYFGPERTMEDDSVRSVFTLLLLAILAVFGFLALRVMAWVRRRDGILDERDRAILNGSHALRSASMLVTLAVWMIGLVESYQPEGLMPLYWLYLVFWSVLLVSMLAFPLGILVGYRSS